MGVDHDYALELHQRLLEGDPTAPARLTELLAEPLAERLGHHKPYGVVDDQDVADAAIDALMHYFGAPHRFDLTKKVSLLHWLALVGRRDLQDLARSRRRRPALAPLEQLPGADRPRRREPGEEDRYPSEEETGLFGSVAALLPDERDRQLVLLEIEGDRSTASAARVLGFEHLPPDEQARQVKKAKDRIKKTIRRKGRMP